MAISERRRELRRRRQRREKRLRLELQLAKRRDEQRAPQGPTATVAGDEKASAED